VGTQSHSHTPLTQSLSGEPQHSLALVQLSPGTLQLKPLAQLPLSQLSEQQSLSCEQDSPAKTQQGPWQRFTP
jgi:hypothetical protein